MESVGNGSKIKDAWDKESGIDLVDSAIAHVELFTL